MGNLLMGKRGMPMKVKGRLMEQVGEIQLEKESLQALLLVVAGNLMEKENLLVLLLAAEGTLMEREGTLMEVEGILTEKEGLQLTVNMLKGMIVRCHIMLKSRGTPTPTLATLMPVNLGLASMLVLHQTLTNLLQTTRNGKNGRKDKECNEN